MEAARWPPLAPSAPAQVIGAAAPHRMSRPSGPTSLDTVLRSLHQVPTPLIRAFFGAANVDALQAELARSIRQQTGYAIDRQDDAALVAVMTSKYIEQADFEPRDVRAEVARLDTLVLREVVPAVASAMQQFKSYVRDASSLPTPLARSVQTSVKGTKTAVLFRPI